MAPKVKQINTPNGRRYDTPDGLFPSVTTILAVINKPALVNWAAKVERESVVQAATDLFMKAPLDASDFQRALLERLSKVKEHQRQLEKAGQIGSAVHGRIEWELRQQLGQKVGPEPELPPDAVSCFSAYKKWAADAHLKPLAIEQVVWSKRGEYAGTMDVFGEVTVNGERLKVVLDWKTGKAIYGEARMQVAAYAAALVEMGHAEAPVHGLIVRLPKVKGDPEPEFSLVRHEEHAGLLEAFMAARRLWAWKQEDEAA